ncbi:hypothetical protein [Ewingella americana]|uniref:Uncharacterized protein n=1 Tax=Ewingella americana TaxID=41202 RepID=A0A502GCT9_9GAMM|nr:hypothetical protein [Ewingella americana]TPG60087.1 hypothetical protein EAH77_16090 [Ewingella americana]
MSKSVKQINLMANQHVPLISNILTVNRGLAYHVDPNLTGTYRNFVRIEAKARLLLPDQSYILDQGSSAGLASLIFKGASQPEVGETLAFKGDQYEISSIQQGIVYITPALRKDAPESSQFRSIAKQIESMIITGDRAMTIKTTQKLFERDVIQLSNTSTLTIANIVSHEGDIYKVETVNSLDSLNFSQTQVSNLICAPQYVSDLIKVEVGCPYYLVFPFASYFQQNYDVFLKIENCDSKGKVLNSVIYDRNNPTNIRVPMFNSIIRASNLVMMRRIMGKLDYNKAALGFYSGSMVEWEEDFPETGTDFWIMSGLSETAGKLIVRYDPLGIVETVPVVRGRNNLKVRAFGALNGKCSKMSIGFISEEGSNADDCFWLSEIIPNQVYTYFRYTLRIESETLFKREHLACYGPKVQPSLPSIDVCFGISRLDSGFLLP